MIQLNSFGCGPDSFLIDEVSAILKQAAKNLTVVRIDEIASPGSVRLRLRSLVESLKVMADNGSFPPNANYAGYTVAFEKKTVHEPFLFRGLPILFRRFFRLSENWQVTVWKICLNPTVCLPKPV
jgi:hypothetical protein